MIIYVLDDTQCQSLIINDNQWYLTKLVGEVFLWHMYSCYVNDISRSKLTIYFCGTRSIPAMSMYLDWIFVKASMFAAVIFILKTNHSSFVCSHHPVLITRLLLCLHREPEEHSSCFSFSYLHTISDIRPIHLGLPKKSTFLPYLWTQSNGKVDIH